MKEHTNVNMFAIIEERKQNSDGFKVEKRIEELDGYMEKRVEAALHYEFRHEPRDMSMKSDEFVTSNMPSRIMSAMSPTGENPTRSRNKIGT